MKNILSSYKNYRKSGGTTNVGRLEFCRIINAFNKHIMLLINEGHEVKLPEKMGTLSVKGKKIETKYDEDLNRIINQSIDYGETNKLWARCPECQKNKQVIYHLNEHSDGIRYKFFWSKEKMIVENKLFYTMVFTRSNKRTLSNLITEHGRSYYVEPKKY